MSTPVTATVRMYRLDELGDCFLLTFAAGQKTTRVLIDCGSFRNGQASIDRLKEIVASIATELNGTPLDVVVGTHQHNDHVSGFVHCQAEFAAIGVSQVWLSWLDDPADDVADDIGKDFNNLRMRLAAARDALTARAAAGAAGNHLARTLNALSDTLGFFGAAEAKTPPELPAEGVRILKKLGSSKALYLRPGRSLDLPGLSGTVRVHVLGPPRSEDLLFRKDPRKGESYDHALATASLMSTRFLDAAFGANAESSRAQEHYPFNEQYKRADPAAGSEALKAISGRYRQAQDAWRTIDDDWLLAGESLALYLDNFTNNSSLVLAFELVDSGKVLLFVADAQTGNWVSWPDISWQDASVSTDKLLANTVFYKVGHHASHNSTLVDAFEKMTSGDLVALIPVHKQDPNITKKGGWKMPAKNLFKRITEKTEHRVLQMDNVNPAACDPNVAAKASWKKVGIKPKITDLFVELKIKS